MSKSSYTTSKEYKLFKKKYIDLIQYGDTKGAEKLKIDEEKRIENLQLTIKNESFNLKILQDKIGEIKDDTDFFDKISANRFDKNIFNPLRAYSASSISLKPLDYKTYNSINSKIADADIYTWKGVTITKPNIGSVPTLIELFLNTMMISRTNKVISLPKSFNNVINFFVSDDTKKLRIINNGISLNNDLKDELTNPPNIQIMYKYKHRRPDGSEEEKIDSVKTNRVSILDDLFFGRNNIKSIYIKSVLNAIPQDDIVNKNLNNLFNKNTLPSDSNLKSIASSIAYELVNNSIFKDKTNADNKNIIKSNIKDTLSSALIIIRDNILTLLSGNTLESNNFRYDFIKMINIVLNNGEKYTDIPALIKKIDTSSRAKPKPYDLKYILDISDKDRNYDLLATIQDILHKNKIYDGILQKNKDETSKKIKSLLDNISSSDLILEEDIKAISKVDDTIGKNIISKKKEEIEKFREDIEYSVKQNIYTKSYEKISAEFIERFDNYKNMISLIKKRKEMIDRYMKQNIPGKDSIEKKRFKKQEIEKLQQKITDKTREYLKESGGSLYLETYYDVVRTELMKQKAIIDDLKKKATSTPPTLTQANKVKYQQEAPILINIYKQFKLITAKIATDPTLIKPPQAKPGKLDISLDTTTSKALQDYLNDKNNVTFKALFYNPVADVQRDLSKKYGAVYVPFQRTLSTNVSLIDIFRGKIIDNIEKIPGGKMNNLFHIIGFINDDQWTFFKTPKTDETPLEYRKRVILPTFLDPKEYENEPSRDIYKAELVHLRTGFSLGEGLYCKDIYNTRKIITGQRIDNDCQNIINDVKKVKESTNIISLDEFMLTIYQNYQELYS